MILLWCNVDSVALKVRKLSRKSFCSVSPPQPPTCASGRRTCTRRRCWRWWCSSWWSRTPSPFCSCAPSSSRSPCTPGWEASSWTSCPASSSSRSATSCGLICRVPALRGLVNPPSLSLQVWKYPKVWEGFVKCCQRTKPQSYSVLLQLPPAQLTSVFERCPEMREPLLQHVNSFTPHQVRTATASTGPGCPAPPIASSRYRRRFCFLCVTASSHTSVHHGGAGGREEARTQTCGACGGEGGDWWRCDSSGLSLTWSINPSCLSAAEIKHRPVTHHYFFPVSTFFRHVVRKGQFHADIITFSDEGESRLWLWFTYDQILSCCRL